MNTGRHTHQDLGRQAPGKRASYAASRGLTLGELSALSAWDESESPAQAARDQVRGILGGAGLAHLLAY